MMITTTTTVRASATTPPITATEYNIKGNEITRYNDVEIAEIA